MDPAISIEPLTGCIGARVDSVDLNRDLDESEFTAIREALFEYKALLFPAQNLDPSAHVAFGRRFGELVPNHPDYPTIEGHSEIMVIENGPQRPPDNESWHKDMTYRPQPPQCSLLHAKVLPARGGDTLIADMEAAFDDLSPPLQALLRSLTVVHDLVYGFEPTLLANGELERLETMKARPAHLRCNVHPAVDRHPVTGNEYLGIDDCFVSRIVELSAFESRELLRMLREHIKQPKYQLRINWQVNDLAVWDNVSTLHYAVGDYRDYRCMRRVTVSRFHGVKADAA